MSKFANGDTPDANLFNKTFNVQPKADLGDPTTSGEGAIEPDTGRVLLSLDGATWGEQLELRSRTASSYWHALYGDIVEVTGEWDIVDTDPSQTDFDDALTLGGNYIYNVANADQDACNFGLWTFHPGNYKVVLTYKQNTNRCIVDIKIGDTVLTSVDTYGVGTYNVVNTYSWANASRIEGAVTLLVNGKNAGSSGYGMSVSRFEIFRVA